MWAVVFLERGPPGPLHLAAFGRRTGRAWTREEVVAMLRRGPSRAREVWCEVKAESLRRFFRTIRENIRAEVPGMLCICTVGEHVRHAREFAAILAAPGQTPTIRGGGTIHLKTHLHTQLPALFRYR